MARVTGIGGVFLRARDPKALAGWYKQHLGMPVESWGGAIFRSSDEAPAGSGVTTWSLFPDKPETFGATGQQAMVNLRVDDLDALLKDLEAAGVTIDPKRDEDSGFGKFAWITDPEGNRVELWQPAAEG